tara:strand:- start:618 stop:893 length:276 start_codon:yes stop_codon:yes gene_type:complete
MLNLRASYDYARFHKGRFSGIRIAEFADHLDVKYNFNSVNSIEIERSMKAMIKLKWAAVDPQTGELKITKLGNRVAVIDPKILGWSILDTL